MSGFTITADVEYPTLPHSPDLESWILGLLLEHKSRTMLDVGRGYSFWSFIVKRRFSYFNYVVGFDLNCEEISKTRIVYDDVIVAYVKSLPLGKIFMIPY